MTIHIIPENDLSTLPTEIGQLLLTIKRAVESYPPGGFEVQIWRDENAYEQKKNPAFNNPAFLEQGKSQKDSEQARTP